MEGQGGILGIISKRMQWLGQRHSVVAKNIANSDTPNYIPKDLTESSFRAALRRETPRAEPLRTHQAHLLSEGLGCFRNLYWRLSETLAGALVADQYSAS